MNDVLALDLFPLDHVDRLLRHVLFLYVRLLTHPLLNQLVHTIER